jgi:periplasmic protein TonB
MMNVAVLIGPGRRTLTELSPRAVVLVVIAALHALILYLLINGSSGSHGLLDASVIEAEVILTDRRIPSPPSLPPVVLAESSPVAPLPLQISIDLPAEQAPPTTEAINTADLGDLPAQPPVAAATSLEVDSSPVIRPRPITGPRGADRYPNASIRARESGAVDMNICVSPGGKVDSVAVAHSSGFPRLDQVALGIASEYRFQPATRLGHPIAACAHYRIIFKVKT